jgi:hypothetical protein
MERGLRHRVPYTMFFFGFGLRKAQPCGLLSYTVHGRCRDTSFRNMSYMDRIVQITVALREY